MGKRNSRAQKMMLFIYADCAKERGYKWPDQGHVYNTKSKCSFCDKYDVVFEFDGLEYLFKVSR